LLFWTACSAQCIANDQTSDQRPLDPRFEARQIVATPEQQLLMSASKKAAREDIEFSIKLETDVVRIPRDIVERVREFEASQAAYGQWMSAWKKLEQIEMQKPEIQQRLRQQRGFVCMTMPGSYVSREEAIKQLGPSPKTISAPPRALKPGMDLEFKNVSSKTRRIELNWHEGYGGSGVVSIKPLRNERVWKRGTFVSAPVCDKSFSVDLQPGETHQLRIAAATDEFDFYLTETGEYQIDADFISGLRFNHDLGKRMLVDDALVMDAKPETFRVEFE